MQLACGHCDTLNTVSVCTRCSRAFVVTQCRVTKGMRQADNDAPFTEATSANVQPCDFCLSKDMREPVTVRMDRGVRQRTCPHCNKEFLTAHGLSK